jgi:lantibiotic modifying enzyme
LKIDKNLDSISRHLLLNSSFLDNIGIMHGKMGIAIFFFHLARMTKNTFYYTYASELIDEIYGSVYKGTGIDFENGLAGIGFGIEYLVQNGFIEADTDEVLANIDERIFEGLVIDIPEDINILSGLIGYGAYYFMRLKNSHCTNRIIKITNQKALNLIITEIEKKIDKKLGIFGEQLQFDIVTNYFTLIWFISEVQKYKFCKTTDNFIEKIKMITKLRNNATPKFKNDRLLDLLANYKLEELLYGEVRSDTRKFSNIDHSNPQLDSIFRSSNYWINDLSIRYGRAGISLIYQELYRITKKQEFLESLGFLLSDNREIELIDNEYLGFDSNYPGSSLNLGLLEGISGIGLSILFLNENNNSLLI